VSAEVVLIGHIVIDTIVRGPRRWQSLGGTVVYGAMTALRHEARPLIVSKVGEDFPDEYLLFLSRNGVDISHVRVARGYPTTRFKLTYRNDERELVLQSRAGDITAQDVGLVDLEGKVAIVGPVIGEVTLDALQLVRSRAALTAVDLQGYLRVGEVKSTVRLARTDAALAALAYADVVHADASEAEALTGLPPPEAAAWMAASGPKVALVTLGHSGAYVSTREGTLFVPPFEVPQVAETTGAGDVFLTVFTIEYFRGASVEEAAAMAASAASFRVERPGFDGLRERWLVRSRAQRVLGSIRSVELKEVARPPSHE